MTSDIERPRQRTVAELLAEHGDSGPSSRRRRRRSPDDDDRSYPAVGSSARVAAPPAPPSEFDGGPYYGQEDEERRRAFRAVSRQDPYAYGAPPQRPAWPQSPAPRGAGERELPTDVMPRIPAAPGYGPALDDTGPIPLAAPPWRDGPAQGRPPTAGVPTAAPPQAAPPNGAPRGPVPDDGGPPTQFSPGVIEDDDLDDGWDDEWDDEAWDDDQADVDSSDQDGLDDLADDEHAVDGIAPGYVGHEDDTDDEYDYDDQYDDQYDEYDEVPAEEDTRARGRAAESSDGPSWPAVIAQWIAGAVGGAALWVLFRYLWLDLRVVAVAAALLVTAGLVFVVRNVLRNRDLRTTIFAILVGLLLTASPAILVLIGR